MAFVVYVLETHAPFYIGGSGVAPKDKGNRFQPVKIIELDGFLTSRVFQAEISSCVPFIWGLRFIVFLPEKCFFLVLYGFHSC